MISNKMASCDAVGLVERIIVLNDAAVGVHNKLYQLIHAHDSKRKNENDSISAGISGLLHHSNAASEISDVLLIEDIERLLRIISKRFPQTRYTLLDIKTAHRGLYDSLVKNSAEIYRTLCSTADALLSTTDFVRGAWTTLHDCAKIFGNMQLQAHYDIIVFCMNLLRNFVVTYLLLAKTEQLYGHVTLVSYAMEIINSELKNEMPEVLRFLEETFGNGEKDTSIMHRLQNNSTAISLFVGNMIDTLSPMVLRLSSFDLINTRVFNLLDEPERLLKPGDDNFYNDLASLNKLMSCIAFGFLLCPAELARSGAINLLLVCLKSDIRTPIHRDEIIDLSSEFLTLCGWYKNGNFKLSNYKQSFKSVSDWQPIVEQHDALRRYLRVEMALLFSLFSEFPGAVPPKLPLLLTILSISRDELCWYYLSLCTQPHKQLKKSNFIDVHITELIDVHVKLTALVRVNKEKIHEYFFELLKSDHLELQSQVDQIFSASSIRMESKALLRHIFDNSTGRAPDDTFEAIRLNYYRFQAISLDVQAGIRLDQHKFVFQTLSVLVQHTKFIDTIENVIKASSSLSPLWFYRHYLFEDFRNALNLCEGTVSTAISIMRVLQDVIHLLHRLSPEEHSLLSNQSTQACELWIRHLSNHIVQLVKSIGAGDLELSKQVSGTSVISRINNNMPVPGTESYFNQHDVSKLKQQRKQLDFLLLSLQNLEPFDVFGIRYSLRDWVVDSLQHSMRVALRTSLFHESKGMRLPSESLSMWTQIMFTYQATGRYLAYDATTTARRLLTTEFSERDDIDILTALDPNADLSTLPLLYRIAAYFYDTVVRCIVNDTLLYSEIRESLINRGGPLEGMEGGLTPTEMQCLAQLIGSSAIMVIQKVLSRWTVNSMQKLKSALQKNAKLLQNVADQTTQFTISSQMLMTLQDVDQCNEAVLTIGAALLVRLMLQQGLRMALSKSSPNLSLVVGVASDIIGKYNQHELTHSLRGCGLLNDVHDPMLCSQLMPFKSSAQDATLWQLLPAMLGMLPLASRWRTTVYQPDIGGFNNNISLIPAAASMLIVNLARIKIEGVVDDSKNVIDTAFRKLAVTSAAAILFLQNQNKQVKLDKQLNAAPIGDIIPYLERLVKYSSGLLTYDMLQTVLPYSLLANYAQANIESYSGINFAETVEVE